MNFLDFYQDLRWTLNEYLFTSNLSGDIDS